MFTPEAFAEGLDNLRDVVLGAARLPVAANRLPPAAQGQSP